MQQIKMEFLKQLSSMPYKKEILKDLDKFLKRFMKEKALRNRSEDLILSGLTDCVINASVKYRKSKTVSRMESLRRISQ